MIAPTGYRSCLARTQSGAAPTDDDPFARLYGRRPGGDR